MQFDLLIKEGTVIDPGAGYNGRMDIGIRRGRIAAVDEKIPAESAPEVIDASDQLVVPGLIDMHAHLYDKATYFGIDPDIFGSQSGVTTWVDAGSSGAMNLQGFRDSIIDVSRTRVFAFVNISGIGLTAQNFEVTNPEYCNVSILKKAIDAHRDITVGIKIRMGTSGGATDLIPLERARRAADELGLPIMLHISVAPPAIKTTLEYLKPGDILTHSLTGHSMKVIDDRGTILPEAKKALDEGLLMDLGHGAGSFSFNTAEALAGQNIWPDFVSTDLHTMSIHGANLIQHPADQEHDDAAPIEYQVKGDGRPVFDLLNCMDKMLCVGMPFEEIIRAATSRPAQYLGLKGEIGTLKPGACADITGLKIEETKHELVDVHGEKRMGSEKVCNTFTLLGGKPFPKLPLPPLPLWIEPLG